MTLQSRRSSMLVSPAWLQEHLADPQVRILDCSAQLILQAVGPSRVNSGLAQYTAGHIPGARYANMADDLSDPKGPFSFTMPGDAQIAEVLGRLGIGNRHTVILYGSGYLGSITRMWYILHAAGHENIALLDGGFERWSAESRPITDAPTHLMPEQYEVRRRAGIVSDDQAVLNGIGNPAICIVNALSREQFHGTGGTHYGRPGRIAGTTSAPAREMIDPVTNRLLPDEQLRAQLEAAGFSPDKRLISYCGGGIAATITAFVVHMLGYDDWSVYDNSLNQWAGRTDLPMETG